MANASLNSTQLIESIKRRAQIPQAQNTFQPADFLAFANEELSIGILPDLMAFHQEFFLATAEVQLQPNISEYPIPSRAIGSKFQDMVYLDNAVPVKNINEMTRISPEDIVQYQGATTFNGLRTYYLKNDSVVMMPAVGDSVTGSLQFFYYLRPNQLVDVSRVAIITAMDIITSPGNTIISVNNVPSNIADNTLIDFMQTSPNHKTYSFGVLLSAGATNSAAKTITLPTTLVPTNLVIGDYIATEGECIYPQIPSELHSVLAQRVAARCLEALGDTAGLTNANSKLSEMVQKSGNVVDNRSEGAPIKIVNFHGFLRGRRRIGRI